MLTFEVLRMCEKGLGKVALSWSLLQWKASKSVLCVSKGDSIVLQMHHMRKMLDKCYSITRKAKFRGFLYRR